MNASVYRNTRFEIHSLQQRANSFQVSASQRGGAVQPNGAGAMEPVRVPVLDLEDKHFTDEEMQQIHDALRILEEKFAQVYDGWAEAPERITEAVTMAVAAESRRKVAELESQRLELEQVEKRALLATLDEEIAAKRGAP